MWSILSWKTFQIHGVSWSDAHPPAFFHGPSTESLVHRPHGRQGQAPLADYADGVAARGIGHHCGAPGGMGITLW